MELPIDIPVDQIMPVVGNIISFLLNTTMENPMLGLTLTGIGIVLLVLVAGFLQNLAWGFMKFLLIIALVAFLIVGVNSLGYNLGFIPEEFNLNSWILEWSQSLIN